MAVRWTFCFVVRIKGPVCLEYREDDLKQLRDTGNDAGLGAFALCQFALVVSLQDVVAMERGNRPHVEGLSQLGRTTL